MHIVDRRLNPGGKSLANRQRFMRRAKSLIRKAVHESSANRSIKDADKGGEITLPIHGVNEPSFRRSGTGGMREYLLPGNKEYAEGDRISRPQGGAGGRRGAAACRPGGAYRGAQGGTRPRYAPGQPDPVYRPAGRALQAVRGTAEADGAGGDVLPDGRVRLDDRAHEGSRQALLYPP